MPDLDDRIRSLVSAAVADAPAAPDVDLTGPARPQRQSRWGRPIGLLVVALVTAVGGYAVLQPADDRDIDTVRPTPTSAATKPGPSSVVVTAGPHGVQAVSGDGEFASTSEPMAFALALDNGDVIAQRRARSYSAPEADAEDTMPLLITTDGSTTALFESARVKGGVRLHDFSVVDSRRLLLYSVTDARPTSSPDMVPDHQELLFALDLDSRATTELGEVGGWEWGTSRLHLASSGLIVGNTSGLVGSGSLFVTAIPGSPAAARPLPKATDYGLDESYDNDDGCICPTNYALDHRGDRLYWVSAAPDGDGFALFSADLRKRRANPTVVAQLPSHPETTAAGTYPDISAAGIVLSYANPGDGPVHPPELLADGATEQYVGWVATVGPDG